MKVKSKINDYNELSELGNIFDGNYRKIYVGMVVADTDSNVGLALPIMGLVDKVNQVLPKGHEISIKAEFTVNQQEAVLRLPGVDDVRVNLKELNNLVSTTRSINNIKDNIASIQNKIEFYKSENLTGSRVYYINAR